MRKIRWKSVSYRGRSGFIFGFSTVEARVGCITLECRHFFSSRGLHRWRARIDGNNTSIGPCRCSLSRAKEDAIRLAKELLVDYHTAIVKEMKNFGVEL